MIETLDHHVLQQVAETGFNRALVLRFDFNEVGEGAHLADRAVGVDQHHARRVGKTRTVGVDLFQ